MQPVRARTLQLDTTRRQPLRRGRASDRPEVQPGLGEEGLHGHGHRRLHRILPLHPSRHGLGHCPHRAGLRKVRDTILLFSLPELSSKLSIDSWNVFKKLFIRIWGKPCNKCTRGK